VFVESSDDEQIIERVAALDIGKAEIVCCFRLPAADGGRRRVQEVSTHSTMVTSLCELANRLVGLGVDRLVMEATSDYWRPPFYLFEAHGLDPWLVNAKDVKHLPGRPKTDRLDAVWLCKVAERGMLRPSFVPPADIRQLRDLTAAGPTDPAGPEAISVTSPTPWRRLRSRSPAAISSRSASNHSRWIGCPGCSR
jgi:transposase